MTPPKSALTRERTRSAWIFLAPTLFVLLLVAGWPLGRTIWFSFTDASLETIGESNYHLVGLANYFGKYGVFQFNTPEGFWSTDWGMAIGNTFKFSLVSVVLETLLGVVFALVLNAEFKGRSFVRAAVLVPWAIPTIVSAKMWAWIMHDQFGVMNAMLKGAGIIDHNIAWTADPDYALWSVMLVDVWKTTPFMALLTLAALQMLPTDCYEAAHVDGIHPVRVFFKVTLPLSLPGILAGCLLTFAAAITAFITQSLVGGGQMLFMPMYLYQQASTLSNWPFAAAISIIFLVAVLACVTLFNVLGRLARGHVQA